MQMKVLGLRSYRDKISWAIVDGTSRAVATLAGHHVDSAPVGAKRGEVLRWVRDEVNGLISEHQPDEVVLCPAEGLRLNNAFAERAQVDGVILEVLHSAGIPATVKKGATIRANFDITTKAQLDAVISAFPSVRGISPTADRREPAVAALSAVP